MIRFLHSADWQLGARFRQFGAKSPLLRKARLDTLRRSLELARQKSVDAFLVAGDLFEDNQVGDELVQEVVTLFGEFSSVSVYLLPGNHDPNTGPDSVWHRAAFRSAPANIHVLTEARALPLGVGCQLYAAPLHQKLSSTDPSLKLVELAAANPQPGIKIGISHGALAIPGKHQPNDFPIALDAASRAGLDYLAVGHWHGWLDGTDGGRILMPGTPEPDQFDQANSGNIALVQIDAPGAAPVIERIPVATLRWKTLAVDFLSTETSLASVRSAITEMLPWAATTAVRIHLHGAVSPTELQSTKEAVDGLIHPFLFGQIADQSSIALSEHELQDLRSRHPILAQVLGDIDRLETLATGKIPILAPTDSEPLSLEEAKKILSGAKIDLGQLPPEIFGTIRQVLLQNLQEAAK